NPGSVLFATDDFFQVAESLILENEPIWDADKFTPFGKWMDGWETRRKRIEGHDWCLIKLGLSGTIEGLHIDTAFFTGNQTPRVSIQAACLDAGLFPKLVRRSEMGTCATEYEIQAACSLESEKWDEILAMSPLKPGYPNDRHHYFHAQSSGKRYTHLRVNYFPDGGVARLRVHGTVQKDWSTIPSTHLIDFLALENGGTPLSCSNKHYGTPFNLLKKTASAGMHDGWETARNPNRPPVFLKGADGHLIMPGKEQATFKLGMPVEGGGVHVETIIVDTAHFKGNYPESILVEGCHLATGSEWREDVVIDWFEIVPRSKCKANTKHRFDVSSLDAHQRKTTHVRLTVFPDGGVARLRVYGRMA
ncbi:allantoicase, partial [Obelidium mucronatum]